MRRPVCLLPGVLVLAALPGAAAVAAPAASAAYAASVARPASAAPAVSAAPGAPSLPRSPSVPVRPRAFASCPALVAYARRHLAATHGLPEPPVMPVAQPGPVPAPLGASGLAAPVTAAPNDGSSGGAISFSTTNNQEDGIDEPDIVKTDGSTIFAVSRDTLYAVTVTGGTPHLAGSLALGAGGAGAQLLLRGSRLIVISGRQPIPLAARGGPALPGRPALGPSLSALAPSPYYYGAQTTLTEVDVHDPAALRITRTMTVDGTFVDARQNGATARLVISSAPRAIAVAGARPRASGWVPAGRFHSLISGRRYVRALAPCDAVRRPVQFSGVGMLTILTIDIDRGLWTADSTALMADAQVVYGSQDSLYVATEKWIDPRTAPSQLPLSQTTVIDRFDATKPDATPFVSSGEVPGFLLNQFSLSEYKGFLRVASTSRPIWWAGGPPPAPGGPATRPPTRAAPAAAPALNQSYVTVLADRGGSLVPVGQVSGLGAGQQIYSVRFLGDAGYVVTYRQVDPLYALDLSTPSAPRLAGQLELQGYSSYLHPVGDGLLLGVGQDVQASTNEPAGTQLELFDVSHPDSPKLLARTALGGGSSSEVQTDHHAFLFWAPTKLAVLPIEIFPVSPEPGPEPLSPGATGSGSGAVGQPSTGTGTTGFTGAIGFHLDASGIAEVGRIVHDPVEGHPPAIRRAVVIGDRLFTLSDGGLMASRLDTLARVAFVLFPQPQPQPGPSPRPGVVGPPASTRPGQPPTSAASPGR